jgi:hypothetical protein
MSTTENNTEPLPITTTTTKPTLEEQIQTVKTKLLQEFETLSKSVSDLETQIKTNTVDTTTKTTTPSITSQPPIVDVEPKEQTNQCLECIDCKEMLIQGIVRFIEKIIRFIVSFFSQIVQMLPIILIFYRITSFITPIKLPNACKPVVVV